MVFEVLRGSRIVCWTDTPTMIYDRTTLEQLQRSGHTFRINGRRASIEEVSRVKEGGGSGRALTAGPAI